MKRFRFISLYWINNKKYVLEKFYGLLFMLDIVVSYRIIWKIVVGFVVWSVVGVLLVFWFSLGVG